MKSLIIIHSLKKVLLRLAFILSFINIITDAMGQGAVTTFLPRHPITDFSQLATASTDNVNQQVQYIDGLGRVVQTIQLKNSPNANDVIQPHLYDSLGRESYQYLPYTTSSGISGSMRTDALTGSNGYSNSGQFLFYQNNGTTIAQTANPYSLAVFEMAPTSRAIEQGYPGNTWKIGNNHTAKSAYLLNASNEVPLWQLTSNGAATTSSYPAGTLYVQQSTDENGNSLFTYTDISNKLICKKNQYLSGFVYTYCIYDDIGNLRYVLPPMPSLPNPVALPTNFTEADNVFSNFFYAYHYDGRNRLIEKKIPGKGWQYFVYNKIDQLILSQTPTQNALGYWLFNKYDANGRIIMNGDFSSTSSRASLQNAADNFGNSFWETFSNGTANFGYTNVSFPDVTSSVNNKILTINYYDNYNFLANSTINPNTAIFTNPPAVDTLVQVPTGSITGSLIYVLGSTTNNYLLSLNYYNSYGRSVQSIQQTFVSGTSSGNQYDILQNQYSFGDQLTRRSAQHYIGSSLVLTTVNYYNYDIAGRKLQTFEQINGGANVLLSNNKYNEIGQLITKQMQGNNASGGAVPPTVSMTSPITGTSPVTVIASSSVVLGNGFSAPAGSNVTIGIASFLQTFNYAYNERGWLLRINNPNNLNDASGTHVFAEQLDYDGNANGYTGMQPQYNGNPTSIAWNTLTKPGSSLPQEIEGYTLNYDNNNRLTASSFKAASGNDRFNEALTYDELGNVLSLTRNSSASSYLNNLSFNYGTGTNRSNKLLSVTDIGSDNYNSNYTYDAQGNAYINSRLGATTTYNELNQPAIISFANGKTIKFYYSATGSKLERVISQGSSVLEDRSFANEIEYVGGNIEFVRTDEGRARPSSNGYVYEYRATDHLGNTRVLFGDENNNGTFDPATDIVQQTNYYVFGKEINYIEPSPLNQYKFSGKELLTDINAYDYGARYYDPTLTRWSGVDNGSEASRRWNPYNYGYNSPVRNIDPDGNFSYDFATSYANSVSLMLGTQISQGFNNGMQDQMAASMEADYEAGKTDTQPIQYDAVNNALMDGIGRDALHRATDWMSYYGSGGGDSGGLYYALNGGDSGSSGMNWNGFTKFLSRLTPFGGVIDFTAAAWHGDVGGAVLGLASSAAFATSVGETSEEMATLYRNIGPNELSSLQSSGEFSISPNSYNGKQFWINDSGLNWWNSTEFSKPYNIEISIPKSYITPGNPNYLFIESADPSHNGYPSIDNYPGGTVPPSNLGVFNSVMKIRW